MPESFRSRRLRWLFNFIPAYRGTGARVKYVSDDFREVRIELPLSWRTRNYVGTIFGGSLYGSVDPVYMIMPMKTLGRGVSCPRSADARSGCPARRPERRAQRSSQRESPHPHQRAAGTR